MYYDIFDKGIDDLNEAVKRGDINIDAAARLANQPEETQKDILNEIAKRQVNAPTDEDENPKIQQKATSNFILEQIEEMDIANALFSLILQDKRAMRKTWLKHSKESIAKANLNNRWKIIDNYQLEIDDI